MELVVAILERRPYVGAPSAGWCFWCGEEDIDPHAADCLYKRLEVEGSTLSIEDFPFESSYY